MTELEILRAQIQALKELVEIKDQLISSLKLKQNITYVPYITYPYYIYGSPLTGASGTVIGAGSGVTASITSIGTTANSLTVAK